MRFVAFAQAGILLSSVCLALVSMQLLISGSFVLEACVRAEAFKERLALDISSGARSSTNSIEAFEKDVSYVYFSWTRGWQSSSL